MKRTWTLIAVMVVLAVAALLIKAFVPVAALDYICYVPLGMCLLALFIKALALYKGLLTMTLACCIFLFLAEGFHMEAVFPKLLWSLIGALIAFLCIYFGHRIRQKKVVEK